MSLFLLKTFMSGLLIAAASTFARKFPGPAGIVVALPVTTFLTLAWMRFEGATNLDIASLLQSVGWITLAGIGLFFVTPWLLRSGWSFWPAFGVGVLALGIGSYVVARFVS